LQVNPDNTGDDSKAKDFDLASTDSIMSTLPVLLVKGPMS
jgi:hypothetical protein